MADFYFQNKKLIHHIFVHFSTFVVLINVLNVNGGILPGLELFAGSPGGPLAPD